jgi:hypothetical protein
MIECLEWTRFRARAGCGERIEYGHDDECKVDMTSTAAEPMRHDGEVSGTAGDRDHTDMRQTTDTESKQS